MRKITLVSILALGGLVTLLCLAQTALPTPGQKAGLWEFKQLKQVMDGKDMTAQMNAAQEKMQQALANMPPDQRAKMETMMGGLGVGKSGAIKVCVSPAMAAKNQPMVDKDGQCPPAKISHNGNQTLFEVNCTRNGRTTAGTGTSTANGDIITTDMNMTMTDAKGQHTMQSQTQMSYLGADCQGVTPADELAKKMQGTQH
jgi:hypothetical protein